MSTISPARRVASELEGEARVLPVSRGGRNVALTATNLRSEEFCDLFCTITH